MEKSEVENRDVDLSIVVPLYNEEQCVAPLLDAIAAVHDEQTESQSTSVRGTIASLVSQPALTNWEVILVDDGSSDQTYNNAIDVSSRLNLPVTTISLQRNFGQTAAMQAGIDAARGGLIVTLDGDLQNDPADIPMMVEHLQANDLDLLVGRRANRKDAVLLRLIPSWLANRLIARVTGVNIRDYGCSLKVYRTSVIRQIRLLGEMHRFIPAWVASVTSPSRIGEVDVRHHARQYGTSKYGITRTFRVILDLMSVLFFMKYRARPGHFFGSLGLIVGAIGAVMLGTSFVAKFVLGQDIGSRPMLLIGAIASLASVQLIAFGILAEMISRIYHESAGKTTYVVRQTNRSGHDQSSDSGITHQLRRAG